MSKNRASQDGGSKVKFFENFGNQSGSKSGDRSPATGTRSRSMGDFLKNTSHSEGSHDCGAGMVEQPKEMKSSSPVPAKEGGGEKD